MVLMYKFVKDKAQKKARGFLAAQKNLLGGGSNTGKQKWNVIVNFSTKYGVICFFFNFHKKYKRLFPTIYICISPHFSISIYNYLKLYIPY